MPYRIAVVGAGAMGTLYAALLASLAPQTGDQIWLVGNAGSLPHLDAIRQNGLVFDIAPNVAAGWSLAAQMPLRLTNLHVTTDPAEIAPVDLALVLVKGYRTPDAARQIKQLLAPNGLALTLQNGLGNQEILVDTLGAGRVGQGVSTLSATVPQPGSLFFTGLNYTSLGREKSATTSPLIELLASRLQELQLPVRLSADITGLTWGKLVINCAANPVAALLNVTNGEMAANPYAVSIITGAAQEAAAVAQALNIVLPYPYEDAPTQVLNAARATAPNINSMLADVRSGRPTEIRQLNGALVEHALRAAVAVPINQTLLNLILAHERNLP